MFKMQQSHPQLQKLHNIFLNFAGFIKYCIQIYVSTNMSKTKSCVSGLSAGGDKTVAGPIIQ